MPANRTVAIAAAQYGCRPASHAMKIASASSPTLRAMFEKGSGDGVTATRAAILPPCATNAMHPPDNPATSCSAGDRWAAAAYAISAATGTRTKV
jgi:hypothetical protein